MKSGLEIYKFGEHLSAATDEFRTILEIAPLPDVNFDFILPDNDVIQFNACARIERTVFQAVRDVRAIQSVSPYDDLAPTRICAIRCELFLEMMRIIHGNTVYALSPR